MKTIGTMIGIAAASVLAAASAAQAATYDHHANTSRMGNWYAGISGDLTWLNHSDMGGGGNIELGYRFGPTDAGDIRLEAEVGYHGADGTDGFNNTHYFSYMGNVYYDFNRMIPTSTFAYNGWHVVPYIGGGLGDASIHYGHNTSASNFSETFHHHDNRFAYEGMAGLTFASDTIPGIDWSIGYRYLGTDTENLHSNNLELALRYHF